jgi:dihydroorotate dehydrogenase
MPKLIQQMYKGILKSNPLSWSFKVRNVQTMAVQPLKSSVFSKLTFVSAVFGVSGLGLSYYYLDPESSIHSVILPIVRLIYDAEESHVLTINLMKHPWLVPRERSNWNDVKDKEKLLQVTLFKNSTNKRVQPLVLRTPIGVAAGLDKNGEAIDSLFQLGFSYVEIGSITPQPQPGNPKPRVFRLEKDQAVINRYGFNSAGHTAVLAELKTRLARAGAAGSVPERNSLLEGKALGINLGKNKTGDEIQDYVEGVRSFGPFADVLIINVSSPNTPGLRDIQNEERLTKLLQAVVKQRDSLDLDKLPPLVVKIAPDLTEPEIESIASAVKISQVDGVIVSNTTIQRPSTLRSEKKLSSQTGGLSGAPLKPYSLAALSALRKYAGNEITIIGCGGITSGKDAVEFAKAGADFVQLYSSFAYQGPRTAGKIKREILHELDGRSWENLRR